MQEAEHIIYGDREQTYGNPGKNLQVIADLWFTYIKARYPDSPVPISVDDVCMMMVLVKIARLTNTPNHHDSMVDICGYTALMERCQSIKQPTDKLGSAYNN